MKPLRSPTVEDVALVAGVSTATVSRALNNPDAVRPELRARVQAAVDRLGYVAHAGARALSHSGAQAGGSARWRVATSSHGSRVAGQRAMSIACMSPLVQAARTRSPLAAPR